MKNFKLNLKGLCRSSQLAVNSDGQTTVERRSNDSHVRRHLPVGLTKLLSLFLLLTLGVGQMWAWTGVSLLGDMPGLNWSSGYYYGTNGSGSTETYAATNNAFKFKVYETWVGAYQSVYSITTDGTKYQVKNHNNQSQNLKYVGNSGIVCFHYSQSEGSDYEPKVWLTRPTVYLKNSWNQTGDWTWKSTTDEGNGYYYVDAPYGASGVNWGTNGTSAWQYNNSNVYPTCTPSPNDLSAGHNCRYRLNTNPSGSTWDARTPTLTITAIWTVTYDANGHGSAPSSEDVLHNATASQPSNPSATGYTFGGWYTDAACTAGNEFSFSSPVTADQNLFAKWTPKTTALTLAKNDGTGTTTSTTATYDATISVTPPSRTGYNFTGYYTAGGSKIIDTDGHFVSSAVSGFVGSGQIWRSTESSLTLTARWTAQTYTAANNLDKNGGDSHGQYTATYDATTIAISTAPAKTGYHVEGYYKEAECANKIADAKGNLQVSTAYTDASKHWTSTSNQTLYAKWTANSYTIAFDPNDDKYVGTATGTTASIDATYDVNYTLTSNGFTRAGYTFAGWNTNANGTSGTNYTDGQTGVRNLTATNGQTVTLYAKWTPLTYSVTLNHGAGTCATTSTTVTMGATYGEGTGLSGSLPTVTPPSGYTFDGWYTAASGGSKVESSTQVTTASDHTIYAHFVEISYVYFYNNLGWENVYVVFNADWSNDHGTGNLNGRSFDTMERIGGTNIWRYTIPEYALATAWQPNIAFSNTTSVDGNYCINTGGVIHRRDFDSYARMFVPDPTNNTYTKNGATYYSTDLIADPEGSSDKTDYRYKSGYWMKYNDTESGYVLKGEWDGESNDFYFRNANTGATTYTVTKALAANTTYKFRIYKHCKTSNTNSSWFINNHENTIVTNVSDYPIAASNIAKANTERYDKITTTAAGDYVFTLTCGTDGTLKLSVTYPLTVDQDYRVLYSWNDGSAHTHASEIIHKEANTSKKISVFVHKEDAVSSRSLTIQKCTAISASGVPTWTDVNTIDLSSITENGVYNFVITQPESGDPTGAYSEPYTGEYYVRADATSGGWDFYKEKGNIMKYSAYSLTQTLSAPYSHYYCMFVNTTTQSVAFTVATEYSPSICDTLGTDAFCTGGSKYNQKLPATANVRFSWNEQTNAVHRSYLKNATGAGNARFLVLHGSDSKVLNSNGSTIAAAGSGADDLKANELLFSDEGDWVYRLNLQAQPGAKASIMARYNGSEQYLTGGADSYETILGGEGTTKYDLKATYDFKTNRLIVAWTPPKGAITDVLSNVDMLWVRHAQESAQEITFGEGGSLSNVEVVGAIEFKYNELIGHVGSWNETTRPLLKYFISFPFDVEMSDIFGLTGSVYGREYVIQKYNGAERAEKGLFLADDGTFWQDMTLDETMHKGEGYCLIMDNDYLNDASASIWTNKSAGSSIFLYFPAKDPIGSITNANENTKAEAHQSYSDRWWIEGGVRKENRITDSHWNLIGSPLFANAYIGSTTSASRSALSSYYTWNSDNSWSTNTYNRSTAFNAMSCILVQWYGDITWTTSEPPASIAARRTAEKKNYALRLELLRNEEAADWAFVEMRDGASSDFVLCEDMMKIKNSGKPNLYLYAGNYDVAYSQVPVENQTIPVGVIIRQNGTYTFSMPSNLDGTVTLIDKFAQTRTNLALGDYEVALERGTINDRFELEINIRNVPTAIDGVTDGSGSLKDGKAHKFIENGAMYILRDGQVFDARGNKVK